MNKDLDEFYKKYSARITEMDDTPLFATGTFGKFKILSVEEYEDLTHENKLLAKALELAVKTIFENEFLENADENIKNELANHFKQQAERELRDEDTK